MLLISVAIRNRPNSNMTLSSNAKTKPIITAVKTLPNDIIWPKVVVQVIVFYGYFYELIATSSLYGTVYTVYRFTSFYVLKYFYVCVCVQMLREYFGFSLFWKMFITMVQWQIFRLHDVTIYIRFQLIDPSKLNEMTILMAIHIHIHPSIVYIYYVVFNIILFYRNQNFAIIFGYDSLEYVFNANRIHKTHSPPLNVISQRLNLLWRLFYFIYGATIA